RDRPGPLLPLARRLERRMPGPLGRLPAIRRGRGRDPRVRHGPSPHRFHHPRLLRSGRVLDDGRLALARAARVRPGAGNILVICTFHNEGMPDDPQPHPITVAIERRIDPDRTAEATSWMQAGTDLASGFAGFLGSGW